MSPVTTHVLDTASGRPAAGMNVRLELQTAGGDWEKLGEGTTSPDGRITDLLPSKKLATGDYRLTFDTGPYFRSRQNEIFYPQVHVVFTVMDPGQHYHIPLLVSPYGYSTYRGS